MTPRLIVVVTGLLVGLCFSPARAADGGRAFDFITHNQVVIAATPAQVWPHLRNVNAWKAGARASLFDGGKDVVGERFKAAPEGSPDNYYFIETVELESERRWTIRLNTRGGELMGYATWTLEQAREGTLVRYDTFLLSRVTATLTRDELAREAVRTNKDASQRMDLEFSRLKQLVETATREGAR